MLPKPKTYQTHTHKHKVIGKILTFLSQLLLFSNVVSSNQIKIKYKN